MHYSPESLRRRPDIEGPGLESSDAADRLLLDESADARRPLAPGELVVIGDGYGALTLGAASDGARGIRVHQDALTGERALSSNAAAVALDGAYRSLPLGADLLEGARVALLRLPRSLRALDDIAGTIAAHADPEVVVFAGGRIKHMSVAMNEVLLRRFSRVDVSHARQKSRVLVARGPHDGRNATPDAAVVDDIEIRAFGGAFAGATLDIGTRFLLDHLPATRAGGTPEDPLIDLACGTGVVGVTLARRHPGSFVVACDQSEAAVRSARATAVANGVDGRVEVVRDDRLSSRPDASASFIALNPPFHSGAAVADRLAESFFTDAARVLRSGGELWCVWNSGLRYRPALERLVGPTRQVARSPKFTVTVSTKP